MSIEYEREYEKLVNKLETFGVFTDLSDPTREFNHIRGIPIKEALHQMFRVYRNNLMGIGRQEMQLTGNYSEDLKYVLKETFNSIKSLGINDKIKEYMIKKLDFS
ncbi:MAG: hypothetical protein PHU12_04420, partial [Candidatus Aenigmarchaeota archaeon]|nr:hypothetical protein [Candidatus Aenigmarchaeota archaeon]